MKPAVFLLLAVGCAIQALPGQAATPVPLRRAGTAVADLTPHHALYKLRLESSPQGTVIAADGVMDYQLSDACEAWATAQRLDMNITDNDGTVSRMVSDYVTWERKDGSLLRFSLRQTSNRKLLANIAGEATRRPDGSGSIQYSAPEQKRVDLPAGTLFPMAQTIALLNGAAAGQKFLAAPLFDGTDENGAEDSFTVMSGLGGASGATRNWPLLQTVASGRVAISFFERGLKDDTPNYQVAMRYWLNGVSDDVSMDFGDFVVKANLVSLVPNGKRC